MLSEIVLKKRAFIGAAGQKADSCDERSPEGLLNLFNLFMRRRRVLATLVDATILALAFYLALVFRFEGRIPHSLGLEGSFPAFILLAIVVNIYMAWAAHAYTIVNRYIGLRQALRVAGAAVVSTIGLVLLVASLPTSEHLTPLSVIPVGGLLGMVGMIGVRFYPRIFYERSLSNVHSEKNMLIVGAGRSTCAIAREFDQGRVPGTRAVGIVDDSPRSPRHAPGRPAHPGDVGRSGTGRRRIRRHRRHDRLR